MPETKRCVACMKELEGPAVRCAECDRKEREKHNRPKDTPPSTKISGEWDHVIHSYMY